MKDSHAAEQDKGTALGLALTSSSGPGAWEYQLPGGAWQTVSIPLAATSALLLPAGASLRFVPATNQTGTANLYWVAWDETQGTSGTSGVDTTVNGGSTAFSSVIDSASLSVAASKLATAPAWSGTGAALTPVLPNTTPAGSTVASVFGSYFADPTAALGIAVSSVTETTKGTWQYSLDGGATWTSLNSATASKAILLTANYLIRFLPSADFMGTATLTAYAWAATTGLDGTSVNLAVAGKTGGTTAFSSTTLIATCLVNFAPVLN